MAEDWGIMAEILPLLERLGRSTPYGRMAGQGLTGDELSQVSFPERLLQDIVSSGPGMNLAMQWSDRPRNALASLVSSLQGGSDVDAAASDAWKGMRGDKETSWGDVFGVPEENWGQRWALDALIDPQNAIPIGTLVKLLEGGAVKGGGAMARSWLKPLMNESGAISMLGDIKMPKNYRMPEWLEGHSGRRGAPPVEFRDELGAITEEIRKALWTRVGQEDQVLNDLLGKKGPNELWELMDPRPSKNAFREKDFARKIDLENNSFWDRVPEGQFSSMPFSLDDYFKKMGVNPVHLGDDIGMQDLYSVLERAAMNDPKVPVPTGLGPAKDLRYKPPTRPLDNSSELASLMSELEGLPLAPQSLEQITNRSRNLPTNTVTLDQLAGDLGRTRSDDTVWWDKIIHGPGDILGGLKRAGSWWADASDTMGAQAFRAANAVVGNNPIMSTATAGGGLAALLYKFLLEDALAEEKQPRASIYEQNKFRNVTGRDMYN